MLNATTNDTQTTPFDLNEMVQDATHMLWNRRSQIHGYCETIFYADKRETGSAIIPDTVFQQLKYAGINTISPIESFNWYCLDRKHNRDVITEHERMG